MKSVQTRVPRTRGSMVALLALGCGAFLPYAAAELPKAGEYKGTLTIVQVITGTVDEKPVPSKTVVKAVGRVYADGTLRVAFVSESRQPIFGKFVESEGTIQYRDAIENYAAVVNGARFEIGLGSDTENVPGPDGSTTPAVWHYTLKMVRTAK